MDSLKVLFAVAEASPLAKVGGLADVAGALPKVLAKRGHDVRLVMPRYATIKDFPSTPVGDFTIPTPGGQEKATLREGRLGNGLPVYLVENERYFGRPKVYGEPDDLERFLFFSRSVPMLLKLGWKPDIVHCHDWHTAFVPCLLNTTYGEDPFYSKCASVLTIHNLAYQGWFDDYFVNTAGLAGNMPAQHPLHPQLYSMLALGILCSDVVSTVSPTYAREILTPEYGEKLDPLLRLRQGELFGILNGIDYDEFNPATDPRIPGNYDASSPQKKAANKAALQRKAKLPEDPSVPLIGMVGRLAAQKGMDILVEGLELFLKKERAQFVLLGSGEELYQKMVADIAAKYPRQAALFLTFDLLLAQLIYAGSDLFLMPSKFEPCGLGQMIALRYGTIPVVRRTGGLADTIHDAGPNLDAGNGFVFEEYSAKALLGALRRAVAAFDHKEAWRLLMVRGMQADFSWQASARKYEEMYRKALDLRSKRRRAAS